MLITQQPMFRHFWYPVMPTHLLDAGHPKAFRLLGEDIVLWKVGEGRYASMEDRCCHRTAKLSMGWLENDRIVCGYHGWAYDCTGQCVSMPQSPEAQKIPYKVKSHLTEVRYGYVWVCLEPDPINTIPVLEEDGAPGFRLIHEFYEPCRATGLRLMENFFDFSHTGFVHKGTFGNMVDAKPRKTEIEETEHGLVLRGDVPVLNADEHIQRVVRDSGLESVRHMVSQWYMPFMRKSQINYPNGLIHSLVTSATPIDDERSMLCQWIYRNDTEAEVSAADCIEMDRRITNEDILILEGLDPDVPLAPAHAEEAHMYTDRPGLAMRRRLLKMMEARGEKEVRTPRNLARFGIRVETASA
ncbi:MAG: aromatic ring-hydroxylating dioxygenase subunit alpha [Hydrogenophaga sp.]|uniref:aromatic ring-hydroxylating dioxygenase subunit alpha n=1 Tax=Hydrogenophaga sp. TaxID=1904254 RepID=UPI0025C24DDA|nr:aromatic ring-hydroxylating dioxygenase subunit alpha [Hydrogenophaga sp.]MBU7572509.1 aromatic ring-hydroxylating dioxygenase subunit alpha [Hydrogenophaga sp.]